MKKKKPILWNEKIPFIKEMKEFYSKMEYKGLNLWPIISSEIYTYYEAPEEKRMMKIFAILKYLFTKDNFDVVGRKNKIFVSYVMAREDHRQLMKKALEKFPKKELTWLDAYEYKKKKNMLKLKIIFPDLILLLKLWKEFKKFKFKEARGWKKMHLFFRTYFRCKQIEQLQKMYQKYLPKAYISFCSSAFPEEGIMTLICKKNKIPTFTMQHGFLSNEGFSPFLIQRENVISDHWLLWGEKTKKILKEFVDESKLVLAGNPKYLLKDIRKQKKFNLKTIGVFLSVLGYEKSNKNLVKIINEISLKYPNLKFLIKMHPFDEYVNYLPLIKSKNIELLNKEKPPKETLEKSDLIIVHNSSVAMEALFYQIPILHYKDPFYHRLWKNNDEFKGLKELENLFKKLKNKKNLDKWLKIYKKELKNNFYFDSKKEVSQVYYEKISKIIKTYIKS